MGPNSYYRNNHRWWVILVVSWCVLTVSLGGCTTLRKKFTRKKKEKTSQAGLFVPVLDPIDYPPPTISVSERYQYHYSLWKIWYRDLLENLERRESDKRQRYLLGQAIASLEEMKKWLNAEQQAKFNRCIDDWQEVLAMYDHPAAMRSDVTIRRKINASAKKIRDQFNPKAASHILISQP